MWQEQFFSPDTRIRVRQTTQNNVSIFFLTGPVEERINTSIDVSENTMEYFFKNLNCVIVF